MNTTLELLLTLAVCLGVVWLVLEGALRTLKGLFS